MFPGLSSLTGGGGLSTSTGPIQGGDIAGSQFSFGGINDNRFPKWVWPVVIIAGAGIAYLALRRK